MKTLWFDTETTGLDANKHGIIQIAMLMEIDGKVEGELSFDVQPFPEDLITIGTAELYYKKKQLIEELEFGDTALIPSGILVKDLFTFQYADEALDGIIKFLDKHISKFDKTDKAYFAQLKDVLKLYQDFEIDSLKTKVSSTYNKLAGDFKTRLNNLVDLLSERNKNDDYYVMFLRIVLIYFFEICLIGKKTESEK